MNDTSAGSKPTANIPRQPMCGNSSGANTRGGDGRKHEAENEQIEAVHRVTKDGGDERLHAVARESNGGRSGSGCHRNVAAINATRSTRI